MLCRVERAAAAEPKGEIKMAIAAGCCLNFFLPASVSESKTTQLPLQLERSRNEKWRKGCVAGMACMIIVGLEMGNVAIRNENLAMAQEMQDLVVGSTKKQKGTRWSDKRMCPPWHLNSLETIVPENLPRPTARRRPEFVDYSTTAAPPVGVVMVRNISNNCFTL